MVNLNHDLGRYHTALSSLEIEPGRLQPGSVLPNLRCQMRELCVPHEPSFLPWRTGDIVRNIPLNGMCQRAIFLDVEFFRPYVRSMDLIEAAKKAGVRGNHIARNLRVGEATVSRWLHRQTPVPSRYIKPFASLLRIPVEQVLPPDEQSKPSTESK